MKRLVVALTVGFLLVSGSTAHAAEKVMYQEITDNKPEVGVSATVYLGDRMLEQRKGAYKECITPSIPFLKTFWGSSFNIQASKPICKLSSEDDFYRPNYDAGSYLGQTDVVLKDRRNGLVSVCFKEGGMTGSCIKNVKESVFQTDPVFLYSDNTFQQVIEYAGRNGDNLKFTYSEFTDGYARQAFTREFQVDLNQGKVAAYKGAVIEIESATNSSITYKVVRNFQQ